ncbi:MAG: FHIPEP family type III secretion protein, partial [Nannocystaceae bacterium]
MPGKQMAIDNDLANGHITEAEARKRRTKVADEADFYGAMDGANKFVKGDAVAGIIITAINIIAGIIIGVAQNDLTVAEATETYTILTVGDGLVSQIPALLVSAAAGLIATRTASGDDLGNTIRLQVLARREPLLLSSVVLAGIALLPGMPTFTFFALSGGCLFLASRAKEYEAAAAAREAAAEAAAEGAPKAQEDAEPSMAELMAVDLLALEVGFDLVPLVDKTRGGELLKRIGQIRKQVAQELGVVVPPVRVRDNLQLPSNAYRLVLSGTSVGQGDLRMNRMLAIDPGGASGKLKGEKTVDPAFGMPAYWIPSADADRADIFGYTVVDPATVAATHLTELIRVNAAEFLGRLEAQELVDEFTQVNPKLVEELIPTIMPLGEVIKVLKNLLEEGVSIRDLRTIFESLADHGATVKDPEQLTELVRQRLSRALTARFADPSGNMHALVLDPQVERVLRGQGPDDGQGSAFVDPTMIPRIVAGLERALGSLANVPNEPLVLTSPDIRRTFAALASRHAPGLAVLSFREVDTRATVKTAGVVKL